MTNTDTLHPTVLPPEDGAVEYLSDVVEVFSDDDAVVSGAARTVDVCHIELEANWNEGKSREATYTPPPGHVIESAKPIVVSKAGRSGYKINTEPRLLRLTAHARGSGKFWDQKRGWINVFARVRIVTHGG
jgi:hypothetical protein